VSNVIVRDRSGRHLVRPLSNAFLYVATEPDVGQRVSSIRASTSSGLVDVPFSPPQFGFGGPGASTQPLPGPTQIQRHVHGGTIGWINRREPRGRPLNVIPSRNRGLIARHTVFGRVIAPDPGRPVAVALTLSTSRHGGKATGLCGWIISRATGAAGGCQIRADLFKHNPLSSGVAFSGSDQFATFEGLASDDVDHVVAFLANGQTMAVPLHDNVYLIDVARSKLPMRLVAYDARNRIIGFEDHPLTGVGRPSSGPAAGRAKTLLKATSPTGATAELLVGGSSNGGRCMYVRWYHERHIRGVMLSCQGPAWHGQPLQLGTSGSPAEVIWGRVRPDVALVRLNFARGSALTVKPTEGMILTFVPQGHLAPGSQLVSVDGFNKAQRRVGTESLRPPGKR
jgi:hypothetical protein